MGETCWLFLGSLNGSGYGGYGGKLAHRLSWEIHRGPIPDDKLVLHKCDVRQCINPKHLYLGTYRNNNLDMYQRGKRVGVLPNRKLTDSQVLEIRNSPMRSTLLAKTYGVHLSTISSIKRADSWKSLEAKAALEGKEKHNCFDKDTMCRCWNGYSDAVEEDK